ncbi:MAG: hypothetical protein IJQ28_06235, partial [Clostridia bacterium]|nr:hypothetical protein [Clostridia bacterium]
EVPLTAISRRREEYTVTVPQSIKLEKGDYFTVTAGWFFDTGTSPSTTKNFKDEINYLSTAQWYITKADASGNNIAVLPLNYAVIYNNRVVGVNKSDIRASALGDFSNYWEYADEAGNPSATGAYATDVGSYGDFTGIAPYNNVLLLFKKDIVYEMYGSMPYTITELCKTGCIDNDSIVSVNGVMYWASPYGFVRYAGGMPAVISHGTDIKTDGAFKSSTDGRKIYCYDGDRIYVYDTLYQMWHIEDSSEVKMFFGNINDVYSVLSDGIYRLNSGTERIEWEFVTKDYTFNIKERKNLSKIWIRSEMSENSALEIYVRQDGGEWKRVAVKTAEKQEMFDFKLRVKKFDSFTIKFKGRGDVKILDIHGNVTVGTSKHRSGASLNIYRR